MSANLIQTKDLVSQACTVRQSKAEIVKIYDLTDDESVDRTNLPSITRKRILPVFELVDEEKPHAIDCKHPTPPELKSDAKVERLSEPTSEIVVVEDFMPTDSESDTGEPGFLPDLLLQPDLTDHVFTYRQLFQLGCSPGSSFGVHRGCGEYSRLQ